MRVTNIEKATATAATDILRRRCDHMSTGFRHNLRALLDERLSAT